MKKNNYCCIKLFRTPNLVLAVTSLLILSACGKMSASYSEGGSTSEAAPTTPSTPIAETPPPPTSNPTPDPQTTPVVATFTVSPQLKIQYLGETAQIDVAGGTPPYNVDIMDGEGQADKDPNQSTVVKFISPAQSGLSIVRVRDTNGQVAYSTMITTEKVLITPIIQSMVANEIFPFRAKGGTLPYTFSIISGLGTVDSTTGDFTASAFAGTVKIKVTDKNGDSSVADLTVQPQLSIQPVNLQIAKNGSVSFSALGGNPPYKFTILSGGGSINSNGDYSSVNAGPSATIKAVDSRGHVALTNVSIAQALLLSPSTALITKSSNFQFLPIGGISPFTYSVSVSGGSISSTGIYSAPNSAGGSYTVTVMDSTGDTATATVQITNSITFALGTVIMAANSTHDFTGSINGGVGTKILTSSSGNFVGNIFTAPGTPGNYQVTVTDSQFPTPNQVTGTIVVNPPLSVTSGSMVGVINSKSYITPLNGVAPYFYSVFNGAGSINSNGIYTAAATAGSAVLRVTDSQGTNLDIPITINDKLSISPTLANLETNGSLNFIGLNGLPPYSFSIKGTVGFINTSTGGFAAGSGSGSSVVVVTDSLGNEAEAQVNIHNTFSVAPLVTSLNPSASITISAMGGLEPYSYVLTSGTGILELNHFTAPSSSGLSVITVHDALGATKLVNINIVGSLQISPLTKSILTGQSLTLAGIAGQPPYSYSIVSGSGLLDATSGSFSSQTSGITLIKVTDAAQAISTATITVTNPFVAGFTSTIVAPGEVKALPVSGGLPPYTYELIGGGGSLINSIYTAPFTAGLATVRITDAENRSLNIEINIASQAPSVQLASSSLTTGATTQHSSVPININILPGVSGLTSQILTTTNGSITGFTELTPTSYSFNLIPSTEGSFSTSIAANKFTDAFNQYNSISNTLSFTFDVTTPTVTLTSAAPSIVNTTTFAVNVHFSEPVFVFSSSSVQATNALISVNTVSTTDYTLTVTPTAPSLSVQIPAGVVVDTAANPNVASNTISRSFDITAPTLTLTTSASEPLMNSLMHVTSTFSESVTGFTSSDIVMTLDGNTYSNSNIQNWTGSGTTYDFDVNVVTSGSLNISVGANAAQDVATNPSLASNVITRQRVINTSKVYLTSNLAPSDNTAEIEIIIKPKDNSGNYLGDSEIVEISVGTNDISLISTAGPCRVANPNCIKAESIGNGNYRVKAKSNTTGGAATSGLITTVVALNPDLTIPTSDTITFDSGQFTDITGNTTITSTYHTNLPAGKNLNIKGGIITFDGTSAGKTFGHLFITGGTLNHTQTTTSTVYSLDINVNSLHLQGGSIDVSGLGYPPTYSFSNNGVPSTTFQGNLSGNSHGGLGGSGYWYVDPIREAAVATYDNYKSPQWPGGGSQGAYGGGVVKITATGMCEINSGTSISADGTTNSGGSAGGTINLNCLGFTGTAGTNAIHANGGSGQYVNGCCGAWAGGGGGGMVALSSTGDSYNWSGSFGFPSTNANITSFKNTIQAKGGGFGAGYEGAAGTVFAKHSAINYGTLIIDNKNQASSRTTYLQSLTGTISSVVGNDLFINANSTPTFNASYLGFYDGTQLRPNKNFNNGTPSDWTDDQILTIVSSPSSTQITTSGTITQVNSGDTFATIHTFDYLDVSGGAVLESNGDIYVLNSINGNTSGSVSNSGLVQGTNIGGALNSSSITIDNTTIRLPLWRKTPTSLTVQGSSNFTMGSNLSLTNISILGGTVVAKDITTSGSFSMLANTTLTTNTLIIPNAFVSLGTLTAGTMNISNSLTVSSGSLTALTLNTNNLTMQSGKLTTNNLSINGNWLMTGGTVNHSLGTTSTIYRLIASVSGAFSMNGGSIDVSNLGYPATYGFSNGGVPSTTFYTNGSIAGSSHGGLGGSGKWYTNPLSETQIAVYDNYRNPQWPGSGSQAAAGGGAFILTSTGLCTINNGASIAADGSANSGGSAGGTINLKCSGFFGSAAANSIHANGGSGQCLNGCSGEAWAGGGGGGMVSLISTGDSSNWSGNFEFPSNSTNLNIFKSTVQAKGGAYGSGYEGAAGTVFAKHSGLNYGALIINNEGQASTRTTFLPSLTGTISSVTGNDLFITVNSTPALTTSYQGFYNGTQLRPNKAFDNSTPSDWTDDQILNVIATPSATQITTSGTFTQVNPGDTFATINILDYLDVSGGGVLESNGDIYVLNSISGNTSGSSSNSGLVQGANIGGALNSLAFIIDNSTIRLPIWRKTPTSLTIQGTSNVVLNDSLTLTNISILGGSVTGQNITTTGSFTMAVGTSLSANTLIISNAFTNLGNITAGTITVNNDLTVSSGTISTMNLNSQNFTMSAGNISVNNLSIVGNWLMTGGLMKHTIGNITSIYRLIASVTGSLTFNGGSINVSGLGYAPNYGFSNNGVPSTTFKVDLAGGSHGGLGGNGYWYVDPAREALFATYDDYKNPQWPGSATPGINGGGVVKITVNGQCEINNGASINADGATNLGGSAGGTINLNCLGFSGTASSNSIHANGGSGQYVNGCCGAWAGGGGGGMIALTSTGDSTNWTGSFVFPDNGSNISTFKTTVQASGGGFNDGYAGGAGTVFAKHSGLSYGALILDNKSVSTTRTTRLPSIAGTIASISGGTLGLTVTSTPAISASYDGFYNGSTLRPNKNYVDGTPLILSDDQILTITSSSTNNFTTSGAYTDINIGDPFATIHILDFLDVSGGAVLQTNGDVYLTQ